MGNTCGSKATTATVATAEQPKAKTQTVPYIVVSSVSLSRKIADENMCASVTNNSRCSNLPTGHKRLRSKYRRKRSSVSPSPDPFKTPTDTIVFEDQDHKRRMEVEIASGNDVPYLTLQPSSSHTQSPPPSTSRASSIASFAETTDDVSLTSDLLKPEDRRRADRQNKLLERSDSQMSVKYNHVRRRDSESTIMNRLTKTGDKAEKTESEHWETSSMKENLRKARSISTVDLLQLFQETGVDKFPSDEDMWKWFDVDSGRSSPIENGESTLSIEEQIMAKVDLLSLYAPIKGPTMKSRVSAIANEIIVLYEEITSCRLDVDKSVKELISSVDAIRSYKDLKHYVCYAR